jgi:hypothetical protein
MDADCNVIDELPAIVMLFVVNQSPSTGSVITMEGGVARTEGTTKDSVRARTNSILLMSEIERFPRYTQTPPDE